jgi:hypothetical protein
VRLTGHDAGRPVATAARPTPPPSVAPSPDAPASQPPASPSTPPESPAADILAWAELTPSGPSPAAREDHTLTLEPGARAGWLFGGRAQSSSFDDLWRYDLATDTWSEVQPEGAKPAGRFGHTGTWVDGVGLVVWSGQRGSEFFNDLWAYDPATNRWQTLPDPGSRPAARYGSCAALGPDGRLWISHGFTADDGRYDDTWAYDFAAGAWFPETPEGTIAPIRCLHDCLWTPGGQFVLYAGQTTGAPAIGDLWARRADAGWVSYAEGPAARQLYALGAVGETGYVFGGAGVDREPLRDLWLLDLEALTWRVGAPTGDRPAARAGAAFLADPEGSRFVLFGGEQGSTALDDTWQLSIGG